MKLFINSITCATQVHCQTCRDFQGGRKWRMGLCKAFILPNNKIDFDCPLGIPWNPTSDQLPELVKQVVKNIKRISEERKEKNRRVEICLQCKDYSCMMFQSIKIALCKARKKIKDFNCPLSKFGV